MDAAQLLDIAADWLSENRLTQSELASEAVSVSGEGFPVKATSPFAGAWTPLGAIKRCDLVHNGKGSMALWNEAYSWLSLYVKRKYSVNSAYDWNVTQGLSKEEIILDMKEAAAFTRTSPSYIQQQAQRSKKG